MAATGLPTKSDGSTVIGRYELHGELASGGMAVVHLARMTGAAGFSKCVAVKRLHPHLARDPEFSSLLLDEARLTERIRHPNVVSTLDVVSTDKELLLVMEYVHGETLARLLSAAASKGERCPVEVAAAITHDLLLGLHAAHESTDATGAPLCIIHRDVSPQNVIVGADGVARVLDFGIAKAFDSAMQTRSGVVKGKVPYLAPEILRFERATPQSDVWSAAVVLWEMLCTQRLFQGDSQMNVWGQVLNAEIARPGDLIGASTGLDDVVMRGLSRELASRYPTALAMAQDLERARRLATPPEVAAWVAATVGEQLAARAQLVRQAEVTPIATRGPAAPAEQPGQPTAVVARAASTTGETPIVVNTRPPPAVAPVVEPPSAAPPPEPLAVAQSPAPRTSRAGVWVAIVVLLAVVAAVFAWRLRVRAAASAQASPATSQSSVGAPVVRLPASTEEPAAASLATSTSSALASASSRAKASADPRRWPAHRPTSTVTSSVRPHPQADPCDPPYTVDEAGRKHFKLECVTTP